MKSIALKKHYINISILLSIISILTSVIINYKIAEEYLKSDGKTRAFFGIKEVLQFDYQYYVVIPGAVSLVSVLLSIKNNTSKKLISAFLLSLSAITIVFLRIWRLFI